MSSPSPGDAGLRSEGAGSPDAGELFRQAVEAIDAGETWRLRELLTRHPELAARPLQEKPDWLRAQVGDALEGFFRQPWLLWFVAEDPVRHGRLPPDILDSTRVLIEATLRAAPSDRLREALDGALRLVSWSPVAARDGVQLPMMNALAAAGAKPTESADQALANRNVVAAERLLELGAPLTLGPALILGRWDDAERLAAEADEATRQFAFVLAALNGSAEGVGWLVERGVPVSQPSADLYAHATPLHHAVFSGSLRTVAVLTAAGADLYVRDSAWQGTPLDWAEYCASGASAGRRPDFLLIAEHLREAKKGFP